MAGRRVGSGVPRLQAGTILGVIGAGSGRVTIEYVGPMGMLAYHNRMVLSADQYRRMLDECEIDCTGDLLGRLLEVAGNACNGELPCRVKPVARDWLAELTEELDPCDDPS